jgi:demethylmenaquinone methyltransferase/2-methoxy-6-polyprenyl-1,4-benzoquinol methylase
MRKPAIGRAAAPRDGGSPGVAILGGSSARSGAMAGDGPAPDKTWAEVPGGRGEDLNGSPRGGCDNPAMSDQARNPDTTHFGYREVPVADKQKLVGEVFSSVAGKYDLMNDLMSLGIHRVWKRYFVATAQVGKGDRVLDLAGGTGDIAALLKDRVGDSGQVVLGDINAGMLTVGRDRMTDRGNVRGFEYVQCNAEKLPFPDGSFDLVTIAFGLRNVTDKDAALREMLRVLRVGGQARVLEFSQVKAEWFRPLYDFHSFKVLPRLGRLFAHDAGSYQYLAESIRQHPPQDELKAMMEAAGFARVGYHNLNAGIVAIHTGYRV